MREASYYDLTFRAEIFNGDMVNVRKGTRRRTAWVLLNSLPDDMLRQVGVDPQPRFPDTLAWDLEAQGIRDVRNAQVVSSTTVNLYSPQTVKAVYIDD